MKKIMLDLIIAFALISLLVVLAIASRSQAEAQETFSPPNVGVGRVLECVESALPCVETINYESSTESLETEAIPQTEASFEEPESTTESIETEEFVEDIDVLYTEEFVEVIPQLDGKYLDVPMSAELQDYVRQVSAEYGIPFELTMAVCYVESGFDPSAISSTGDYGLMQISYVNHGWLSEELGVTDFLNPYDNIRAGCHILADKIRESGGNLTTALMRYNRGNAVALQQMSQGIFSTDYTNKVLSKYYEYIREG